jgi:hypothetical protein
VPLSFVLDFIKFSQVLMLFQTTPDIKRPSVRRSSVHSDVKSLAFLQQGVRGMASPTHSNAGAPAGRWPKTRWLVMTYCRCVSRHLASLY